MNIHDGIEQMAKMMIERHTYEFSSFHEAKDVICVEQKFIEYDRLTLMKYNHNLTNDEYSLLCRFIGQKKIA